MSKKIFILIFAIAVLSSCRNGAKDAAFQNSSRFETVLITDTLPIINLSREVLPIDLIYPTDMVAIDTFLVVLQHHEEKIIKVFSINSYKFLGEFLRKGGGPNEVIVFGRLSQWFMEEGEPKIMIQSYPNYLAVLNIRKSIEAGETVYDRKYTFEKGKKKNLFLASNSVYEINQSELMMTKDPLRSGITDNCNFFWEFYDCKTDGVKRNIVYENFTGMIDPFLKESNRLLKPDRKKAVLLYSKINLIGIVDLEQASIKQIYPGGKTFNVQTELEIDNRKSYFDEGECTDQYIFALSSKGGKVSDKANIETAPISQLDVFDWNGNYIYKVDLGERIRIISVDNNQRYLYAVNTDDAIIRYDLSALK
ncbi:BF3164 family lipoprotein [Bacteroides bouchesdurhonensis]